VKTIVISGLSGAGKSAAIKTFEDLGYYCVDNLPVPLLHAVFDLSMQSVEGIQKLALVIDARDKEHIGELPQAISWLKEAGENVEVMFLEASDEVLARRFSETRRRHPMSPEGSALQGIQKERKLLGSVLTLSDQTIDTSNFNPHDLRRELLKRYREDEDGMPLTVQVTSFGFKYGLPPNSDMVFDVRFLSNPYFREELKKMTGLESQVRDFVLSLKDAQSLLSEIDRMLQFLLPKFTQEGKSYLNIGIGCTGGRHRSVVITQSVAAQIEKLGYPVSTIHRDRERV